MGINFIGPPLLIIFIAAVIGILAGLILKKGKLLKISLVVFAVDILAYIVLYFVFH